jgi:hypothetical protein
MKTFPLIGIQIPQIFLPKPGIDLQKWSVIACDQFTSEPEYWKRVEKMVGSLPSTYNLVLPEVFLGTEQENIHTSRTKTCMRSYLQQGLFDCYEQMILVERSFGAKVRHGLMMALDLEQYNFNQGSQSLIRATEGTIIERLPPRIKIRESAILELPHILVLIDDPMNTMIGPLLSQKDKLPRLYDFDLMLSSGHLAGWVVDQPLLEAGVIHALENLANPETFYSKYQVSRDQNILLFAVGDGNHSLATAKAIWEKIKHQVSPNHPARYALVEIINVHDEGLDFAPIHRVLFDVKEDFHTGMAAYFGSGFSYQSCQDQDEMVRAVSRQTTESHVIGVIQQAGFELITIANPASNLPVGTLQPFLDRWLDQGKASKIDYVHGTTSACMLGALPGNVGFYLPVMAKSELFKTVILDGTLPRKTFSMGEAIEKRFYMEARQIRENLQL